MWLGFDVGFREDNGVLSNLPSIVIGGITIEV